MEHRQWAEKSDSLKSLVIYEYVSTLLEATRLEHRWQGTEQFQANRQLAWMLHGNWWETCDRLIRLKPRLLNILNMFDLAGVYEVIAA